MSMGAKKNHRRSKKTKNDKGLITSASNSISGVLSEESSVDISKFPVIDASGLVKSEEYSKFADTPGVLAGIRDIIGTWQQTNLIAGILPAISPPHYLQENLNSINIGKGLMDATKYVRLDAGLGRAISQLNNLHINLSLAGKMNSIAGPMKASHDLGEAFIRGHGLSGIISVANLQGKLQYHTQDYHGQMNANSILHNPVFERLELGKMASQILNTKSLQSIAAPDTLSNYASITGHIRSAERALSTFAWGDLGVQIGLNANLKSSIATSFFELSTDYSELLNYYKKNPISHSELNKAAAVEYYTSATILEIISNDDKSLVVENVGAEIQYENEYTLNLFLPKLHPGLLKMWKGAIETYNSINSDKIRQFTVSVRELFTHLIHILAPDDAVKQWTTDSTLYHQGRPIRKARLKYIYRNIDSKPFIKFAEKDIQATIEFIDIFQEGTHSIEPKFTIPQLLAIKTKAEATIKFLIEIEFSVNRIQIAD